jgi:hypothetical protein
MSPTKTDLATDPLFQLNLVLWLTQPLPEDNVVVPLLYQCGFSVYAIAPALPVPPDVQLAAQGATVRIQTSGRPDVVLTHEKERKFAFVECKASSFGPRVEAAEQARAFILIAGARAAEVLGLDASQVTDSILAYVVPESQKLSLEQTLIALTHELTRYKLPAGRTTVLGLQASTGELTVSVDATAATFLSLAPGSHEIMRLQPDTDPRPLYFIPYDPDVDQSADERLFCKRVLFERIHSAVLVAIGRANPPVTLTLLPNNLLNDATFGMFSLWQNRDSASHMRALCRQLLRKLAKAVNGEIPETFSFELQTGWKVSLPDADRHEQVVDAVSRFSCETMNLRAAPEPELFDE